MKHSVMRWGLVLSLLLTLVTVSAGATDSQPPECTHTSESEHSDWTPLGTASSAAVTISQDSYLTGDITAGYMYTVSVAQGKTINICLNGYSITSTAKGHGFSITGGGTVNICDCKGGASITHTNTGYSALYIGGGTTVNLFDVTLENCTSKYPVWVNNAGSKLNFVSGAMDNNNSNRGLGVIYISAGTTVNMYEGATISNNKTVRTSDNNGGGVYVLGTFNMYGGTIEDNEKNDNANAVLNGGGVYVGNAGVFNMHNGTISGNIATNGGGVYVLAGGTFNLSGGKIEDNDASKRYGGGVYVAGGTFDMSGGEITGNTAGTTGGVFAEGGTSTITRGTVNGNMATSVSGLDVRVQGTAIFTIDGGTIGTTLGNAGAINLHAHDKDDTTAPTLTLNGGTFGVVNGSANGGASVNFNGGTYAGDFASIPGANVAQGKEFLPYDNSKYIVAASAYEGANMVIGKSLDMNFYFDATAAADATKATIYLPGATKTVDVTTDVKTGNRMVEVPGVAAKQMTETIKVILQKADGTYVTSCADSVKAYGERVLNDSTMSDAHTVIVDMLNYGAAAQNYFDYNTSALANAGITATGTDGAALLAEAASNPDLNIATSRAYHSANLTLDDQVDFNLYFWVGQIGDTKDYTYSGPKSGSGTFEDYLDSGDGEKLLYQVKIEDLTVADLAQAKVTFNFKENGESKEITDSVINYLVRNDGYARDSQEENSDTSGLYAALMAFADSAYDYYASGDAAPGRNGTPIA